MGILSLPIFKCALSNSGYGRRIVTLGLSTFKKVFCQGATVPPYSEGSGRVGLFIGRHLGMVWIGNEFVII